MKKETILEIMNLALDEEIIAKNEQLEGLVADIEETRMECSDVTKKLEELRLDHNINELTHNLKLALKNGIRKILFNKLSSRFPHFEFEFSGQNLYATFRGVRYELPIFEQECDRKGVNNVFIVRETEAQYVTQGEIKTRIQEVTKFLNNDLRRLFWALEDDGGLLAYIDVIMGELATMGLPEGEE